MENEMNEFELAIHLAGGQSIPNMLGVLNIQAEKHLLLTSKETDHTYDQLQRCKKGQTIQKFRLQNPMDMNEISEAVQLLTKNIKGKIAVNVTGGTKPMAFGVMEGIKQSQRNSCFYYFDTRKKQFMKWKDSILNYKTYPIDQFLDIDDFFKLSRFAAIKGGCDIKTAEKRRDITIKIWKNRLAFASIQTEVNNKLTESKQNRGIVKPFKIMGEISVKYDGQYVTYFSIDGKEIDCEFIDLTYLASRWFEEYVYWLLEPLKERGEIKQILLGTQVMFDKNLKNPAQEFDLLITDGLQLTIIECKAGKVEMENLDKLENVTEKFAGIQGVGVLVALKEQDKISVLERTQKSKRYALIHGDRLESLFPQNIIQIKPGTILPSGR